jgi:hypothetical protein
MSGATIVLLHPPSCPTLGQKLHHQLYIYYMIHKFRNQMPAKKFPAVNESCSNTVQYKPTVNLFNSVPTKYCPYSTLLNIKTNSRPVQFGTNQILSIQHTVQYKPTVDLFNLLPPKYCPHSTMLNINQQYTYTI